jgi:alkylated DNA repair dioxygenase AlkB
MSLFPFSSQSNLLPEKGEVYYFPGLFPLTESNQIFQSLKNEIEWVQEPIWIFGKQVMQPRLTALYGDPSIEYGYSGIQMQPKSWTSLLNQIKTKVEGIAETQFTHVLLNFYRDGNDSMGWHRDNEKELGHNPVIGSVSFGQERPFQLRFYQDKTQKREILLENGSFLLMKGESQHFWEHQLPKRKKLASGRINLTFRRIFQSTSHSQAP